VTQRRFVDDPSGAVVEADALVRQVRKERGYPTEDFEQRAADISVEHPQLVERYRTAHGIAQSTNAAKRPRRISANPFGIRRGDRGPADQPRHDARS
jgi:hypothetical protein